MPISSASRSPRGKAFAGRDRAGGFSMLEVVLALVVLGLLATLGLPFVRPQSGTAALRAQAQQIAALLRAERNAAIASGTAATVLVDQKGGSIRSGQSSGVIVLPKAVSLRLSPANAAGIRFDPDGQSSGGQVLLQSGRETVEIEVSAPTALVRIKEAADARR
ncbi:GspH/FimT family pseudopilin [Rhizobium rhizosphaerae]|nr:GspH/FimT family pseudopilin [Xaviernesmea rhizosphaerae]